MTPEPLCSAQETQDARKAAVRVAHPIPPVCGADARILILGSFPSVKSREARFFYGHPRNRFWQVLAAVFDDCFPETVPERRDFLLRHRIAAWDVIASCEIVGSSDSSIRNAVPNDIRPLLGAAQIREIYVNGQTAGKLYRKYIQPVCGLPCRVLPSTSPANAALRLEDLIEAWHIITGPEPLQAL